MIIQVQEDKDGELFLQFPQQMIDDLGWSEGDELAWIVHDDGTIILKKKEDLNDE